MGGIAWFLTAAPVEDPAGACACYSQYFWQIPDEGSLHKSVPGDPVAARAADSFALEICRAFADPRCSAIEMEFPLK